MVKRPVLRYHGGKWRLAPWIISHFPPHKVYVEPFGGGASVLLRKHRVTAEIYNDLDGEVVNLFAVLRDPVQAERLARATSLTPFARDEWEAAQVPTDEPIEQARRTLIKGWMGQSTKGVFKKSGFDVRMNPDDAHNSRIFGFADLPNHIVSYCKRLRGVVIENRPALQVIQNYDSAHTLFYIDPPYVLSARTGSYYRHEMTDDDHRELADLLQCVSGMVVLSGYDTPLYQELYGHWPCVTRVTTADGGAYRTEVLWLSPNIPSNQFHLEISWGG